MQVKFDSLNRYEVPGFTICNPGSTYRNGLLSKSLGAITNTSDEEIVIHFNATSELNFRAYKVPSDGTIAGDYVEKIYHALKNRRLVFAEGFGYFIITDVVDGFSDGVDYKDISASSCEIEIQNKSLTYIENNTYRFIELLEKIVATLPKWTIGSIDSDVADKHRTFEDVDVNKNTLAFLMEDMQDAYECIFTFDTINRRINVFDQNNYVIRTDIHLTKDDLINELEISESSEDLYTALSVYGGNDLTISAVNPLGTNVIYDFSYYLDWMSDELKKSVIDWSNLLNARFDTYFELNTHYHEKLVEQSDSNAEISRIKTQIEMYRKCRENIIAESSTESVSEYNEVIEENGGKTITIHDSVDDTVAEIDNLISQAESDLVTQETNATSIQSELDNLSSSISEIHNEVSIQNFFSQEEYEELYDYIYEGIYNDEYIIVTENMTQTERLEQMRTLYDRAKKRMVIVSHPTQEFSVNTEDFIFEKKFQEWSRQLEVGSLINVELGNSDIAELFLSTIQLNWDDKDLTLTFGNRFNKFDPKTLFNGVLGDVQKTANTVEYIKDVIYPVKSGKLNEFQEALRTSRTLTMNAALSSANQEVTIDGSGYTGRKKLSDGEFDPRQIKITSNSIVFTDDAWETCKTALGQIILDNDATTYGLNAETIIGEMIIGGQLNIYDKDGNELLSVIDNKISLRVSDSKESIKSEVKSEIKEDVDASVQNAVDTAVAEVIIEINSDIDNLQSQIDGNITTWFFDGEPASNNEPAANWTTIADKDNHLGDLYYDNNTGYAYRWCVQNGDYLWLRITDTDVVKALADAKSAQDTADSKRRTFISQPVPPYDEGDLWVQGEGGDIMHCQISKAAGQAFSTDDWILASKYTDDSKANQVEDDLNSYKDVTETKFASLDITADGIRSEVSLQTEKLGGLESQMTHIQQASDSVAIQVQSIQENGVNKVTTDTGFTFNEDGLRIQKSGEEIENLLDNTGMYVYRSGEMILQANANGVRAIDVTVENYFIVGNSRFEDYDNGTDSARTGCFWV